MTTPFLDTLRSGGDRVSAGGFTLDRDKAREKLSRFQLADPHHYVLEFVQAAHILGATYIDIELDANEMKMAFDGTPLGRAELENLYRAGFTRQDTPELRALKHLAIGVTAAWALDPSVLRIDVDDGESCLRAELDRGGDDVITARKSSGSPRTTIYLRERPRPGHVIEFVRHLSGVLAEEVALREYCAHSDIPILLNRRGVSDGHALGERADAVVRIDTPRETGRLGVMFEAGLVPSRIAVLTNGVRVTEVHGSEEPFGYEAIVDSTRLRKGLSQADIVRDDAWNYVRRQVVAEALCRSLAHFVDSLSQVDAATYAHHLRRAASWLWKPPSHESSEELEAARRRAKRVFRRARIWRFAHRAGRDERGAGRRALTSLEQLGSASAAGAVNVSTLAADQEVHGSIPTCVLVGIAHKHIFEAEFGARLRDITEQVRRAIQRAQRIDELTRRGRPSEPDPDYFRAHETLEIDGVRGFVGVRTGSQTGAHATQVEWSNQRLILHRENINLAVPSLYFWFNGPLQFRTNAPHFEISEAYANVACGAIKQLPELAGRVIDELPAPAVVSWLLALTSLETPRAIAEGLKLPSERIEWLLMTLRTDDSVAWTDLQDAPAPQDAAEIQRRLQVVGALADTPSIEIGLERRLSLRELLEIYREDGRLLAGHEIFPQASGPRAITGGAREQLLVERFFGPLQDPREQEQTEILDRLHRMHGSADRGSQPGPVRTPTEAEPTSPPPDPSAQSMIVDLSQLSEQLEEAEASGTTPEQSQERTVQGRLETMLEGDTFAMLPDRVELEEREGAPAAIVAPARCILNTAHPIIASALDRPDSPELARWAMTSALAAIAAGADVAVREFAFGHLADLVEAP